MIYWVKGIIVAVILINTFNKVSVSYESVVLLLLLISLTLVLQEYRKVKPLLLLLEGVVGLFAYSRGFSPEVLCLVILDLVYLEMYYYGVLFVSLIYLPKLPIEKCILVFALTVALGVILKQIEKRSLYYRSVLDDERRIRYDLEIAQNQLLLSNQEIERLTEAKERNRIARDLHDNIGHSLAGILIQLQAGIKMLKKDPSKSETILDQCVVNLQNALTTVRDTVHNMYQKEKSSYDRFKEILDHFHYCPVDFEQKGQRDYPVKHLEVLCWILKEALTNVSKYSQATRVEVELTYHSKMLRLYIKDNGKGCQNIIEGLGIKSMKDRLRSVGGIFSMDAKEGMRIVCTIPMELEE